MRNGTARNPSLGASHGGVRFTEARRPYVSPSASYARTGWENAPIEAMDDDATGQNFLRGLANGLAITAMAAAFVLFVVVPLLRWALS